MVSVQHQKTSMKTNSLRTCRMSIQRRIPFVAKYIDFFSFSFYQRSNWVKSKLFASAIAARKSSHVTACPSWR